MEDRFVREFTLICANEERVNISLADPGETPFKGTRFHWASRQGNNFTACGGKLEK